MPGSFSVTFFFLLPKCPASGRQRLSGHSDLCVQSSFSLVKAGSRGVQVDPRMLAKPLPSLNPVGKENVLKLL